MKKFTKERRAVSKECGRRTVATTNDLLKPRSTLDVQQRCATGVLFIHASLVTFYSTPNVFDIPQL